jgi:tetratricopeptide (TPR) repeat protein
LNAANRHEEEIESYRKNIAIMETLVADEPGNSRWVRDLATSFRQMGDALLKGDRDAEALDSFWKSLAILQTNVGTTGNEGQRDVALTHQKIGEALLEVKQADKAVEAHRDGIRIFETLAATAPNDVEKQRELSSSYNKIAEILLDKANDRGGALEYFQKALGIRMALAAAEPRNLSLQDNLAFNHYKIGQTLQVMERDADALESFRRATALNEKVAAAAPTNLRTQKNLLVSYDRVANLLQRQNQREEATAFYRKGVALAETLVALEPSNPQRQVDLAQHLFYQARAGDDRAGNLTRALAILQALDANGKLPKNRVELKFSIQAALDRLRTPQPN